MIKRFFKCFFSFGMLTWLAILALTAGLVWQLLYSDRTESKKLRRLTEKAQAQEQALVQIGDILATHDQQFQQIAEHSNQLLAGLKELDAIVRGDNRAWRIMQAQNFIEMAMVQASLLNDTTSAINLLAATDHGLKQIDNPNLLPVRKAIQSDIAMLANHPTSNITNVVLTLNGIAEQVPSLPHKIRLHPETPAQETGETEAEKPTWKARFKAAWQEFKSLIRIQHHDQPVIPYFSQDDVWLINENLSLMLQQAGFAAVHHHQALYKQEISQAQDWITHYFDLTDPRVQAAQKTLTDLAKLTIESDQSLHLQTADAWGKFMSSSQVGGK
jgi:uroporphyrin-3 C-methyltransferase